MYHQNYDPTGNAVLSTIVAAIPIAVLLYRLGFERSRHFFSSGSTICSRQSGQMPWLNVVSDRSRMYASICCQ